MKPERVRRFQTVAIFAACILLLAALVSRQFYVTEKNELRRLYLSGSGGDLASVERLSESRSGEAVRLLEKLAQGGRGSGDSRVAAITALANKPAFDANALGPLIQIDQLFAIRHAVAEVLEHRGCDKQCISATLHAIDALLKGEPPIEAGAYAEERSYGLHPDAKLDARINAEIRSKTEQDYHKLLNSNACAARNVLKQTYSSESTFIESVLSQISPCEHS
jgi:hypothetical protein